MTTYKFSTSFRDPVVGEIQKKWGAKREKIFTNFARRGKKRRGEVAQRGGGGEKRHQVIYHGPLNHNGIRPTHEDYHTPFNAV